MNQEAARALTIASAIHREKAEAKKRYRIGRFFENEGPPPLQPCYGYINTPQGWYWWQKI